MTDGISLVGTQLRQPRGPHPAPCVRDTGMPTCWAGRRLPSRVVSADNLRKEHDLSAKSVTCPHYSMTIRRWDACSEVPGIWLWVTYIKEDEDARFETGFAGHARRS